MSTNREHENPWGDQPTPYQQLGAATEVRRLVDAFYDVIEESSPSLRAMLPANTKNTREKLYMYLSGWLGGPPLYEERWGHPRLRMRHLPFPIAAPEAEEWMRCMGDAIDRVSVEEPLKSFLIDKFGPLADHMRNQ